MPKMTSMLGSVSRAWIIRPPQNVSAPVTRTRRLIGSTEPDAAPIAQHVEDGLLELSADLLGLLHDAAFGVPILIRRDVEADRIEHLQLDLGGEGRDHAERSEGQQVGGAGKVR